jgi:3-oxoacyl-[acyl-carrier-protein] synthase I
MTTTIKISSTSLVTSQGCGRGEILTSLQNYQTGLKKNHSNNAQFNGVDFECFLGAVKKVEEIVLPSTFKKYDCRNNRLAYLALHTDNFYQKIQTLKEKYNKNIPLFFATSTSGIQTTEKAYQRCSINKNYKNTHQFFSLAKFTQDYLDLEGHCSVASTACSSSLQAVISACNFIKTGLSDVAIVGAADSLCLTTIYGFKSLGLVSENICKPWDKQRNGISIGEAAGFIILEKCQNCDDETTKIIGTGSSSDGFHMSSPHPQGIGAELAITQALIDAKLNPQDIDYINLHGTATPINDKIEDKIVAKIFPNQPLAASTKGYSGHTLAAAGLVETIICKLAVENDMAFGTLNYENNDLDLSLSVLQKNKNTPLKNILNNSFGFGGNNCCIILQR